MEKIEDELKFSIFSTTFYPEQKRENQQQKKIS